MRYRNTKTGLILTTDCRISGEDFEEIKAEVKPQTAPKEETKAVVKETKPKTTTKRAKK